MKNHPSKKWPAFSGMSDTDDPDRIPEDELELLLNAYCDPTGKIAKWPGIYPVTSATALGVAAGEERHKVYTLSRTRGKNGQARAVAIVGSTMLRTGPNNIYDNWVPITFPTETSTPALARPAEFAFRNRYAYHQNGVDLPFRVKMDEDDESTPSAVAEILGLRAPGAAFSDATTTGAGTRFPVNRLTTYAVTYVYGERGESGPSMLCTVVGSANADGIALDGIPLGPSGVTSRRIYRSQIGAGATPPGGVAAAADAWYSRVQPLELFYLGEINDNSTRTFTDTTENAGLDYSRRCPPPRPMPPIAKYQKVHQDRIVWANLREHPWVATIVSHETQTGMAVVSATITISNTGNGTITVVFDGTPNTIDGTLTITDYKTKTLKQIRATLNGTYATSFPSVGGTLGLTSTGILFRVSAGVDEDRTYVFKEVTSRSIANGDNLFSLEAIDGDAVVTDSCEKFPNRVMFSNLAYPEEINPLNFVDVSRHDVYPITGTFRDDYTFGICTENDIWLLTGSFSVNPETFAPDFSLARSQSEHGSFCTRPDAIVQTPKGIIFIAKDGLRLFRGQNSVRFARQIRRRLMERIIAEPRARENVCLHYESGILYIAYPGREVA